MAGDYTSLGPESGFPVMTDPAIDEFFGLVRHHQKELDYSPNVSDARVREILEDLNENWPLMHYVVGVSGYVESSLLEVVEEDEPDWNAPIDEDRQLQQLKVMAKHDDEQKVEKVKFLTNDQPFVSLGFCAEKSEHPFVVGGYDAGHKVMLKLLFQREVEINLSSSVATQITMPCTADLGSVLIDTPNYSEEAAEIHAREYFSEPIAEVDELIDDTMTASEKITALSIPEFKLPDYITYYEKIALERYLDALVGLADETMPFMAELKADSAFFGTDEDQHEVWSLLKEKTYMLSATGIRVYGRLKITPHDEDGISYIAEPEKLDVRLVARIVGSTPEDDTAEGEIRLCDIVNIRNVREMLESNPVDTD